MGAADSARERQAAVVPQRALLLRCGIAVAALFHLAGNPAVGFGPHSAALPLAQLGVGVAAVFVLLRPRIALPFLLLCGLIPLSAWLEAPAVGNHWVLSAAICLGYLVSAAAAWSRRRRVDEQFVWLLFAPAGRWTLLLFYGFAAFSKLNADFFDPVTSCAVFYQDQLVSSWGLEALSAAGHPAMGTAVAVGAAVTELSVPLLLLIPRTRRVGVLLAMAFHWSLALDLAQHFWDFTSVLFTAFLLFLDDGQVHEVLRLAGRLRARLRPSLRLLSATIGLALAALATAAGSLGEPVMLRVLAVLAGHVTWLVAGTGTLAVVVLATRRTAPDRRGIGLRVAAPAALLVPALVAFNGLTPYLELKTGFGWNMYSNLRTVAGETNHLLVPATWDLTGLQSDRVDVLASSDQRLLERAEYEFVWSEFREYARDHPDVAVTYRRGEVVTDADRLSADRASAGSVSQISRRLQSFRAVDVSGAERCLDVYGPAR